MIIITVQRPHLVSVRGSVPVTGQPVQFSGSGKLFWGRGRFGRFRRFELFLGRPLLSFPFHNLFPVFQVPPVFSLFHFLWISIRHVSMATDVWSGLDAGLYLEVSPPISDLDPRLRGDLRKNLYPWGAPPSILLLCNQPLPIPYLTLI